MLFTLLAPLDPCEDNVFMSGAEGSIDMEWRQKVCNRTGLSRLPVNTAGPRPHTASETDRDQYDNREYSTEVIYRNRRSMKREWSERVVKNSR